MEKAKEFLEMVVRAIVSDQDAVKIDVRTDEMGVLMTLSVAQPDMGKVIGKEGNTAKALRTLLRVVGMGEDARVNLKISDPEGSSRRGYQSDKDQFGV